MYNPILVQCYDTTMVCCTVMFLLVTVPGVGAQVTKGGFHVTGVTRHARMVHIYWKVWMLSHINIPLGADSRMFPFLMQLHAYLFLRNTSMKLVTLTLPS